MNRLTQDYRTIVLEQIPLVDLRAPIEYEKGSFPHTTNLPLMTDEERHLVGTCYKKSGQEAAIALGHQLVSGEIKETRIQSWVSFFKQNPQGLLFCFRGGMRSQITQSWIEEASGLLIPRLEGGYKAFRQFLISSMEPEHLHFQPMILTGSTGSGKTLLLNEMSYSVDLEGLANHRGSSFGGNPTGQPTQIAFENQLAYALIQQQGKGFSHLLFEDESRNIGRSYLPKDFYEFIKKGSYVLLHVPLEKRVENIFQEYVLLLQKRYEEVFGEEGLQKWNENMENSLHRIQKRLGFEHYEEILNRFRQSTKEQMKTGKKNLHTQWIHLLLLRYYDPMYAFQIQKKMENVVFQGEWDEVHAYLRTYEG